jgi:hypothetical protein
MSDGACSKICWSAGSGSKAGGGLYVRVDEVLSLLLSGSKSRW